MPVTVANVNNDIKHCNQRLNIACNVSYNVSKNVNI